MRVPAEMNPVTHLDEPVCVLTENRGSFLQSPLYQSELVCLRQGGGGVLVTHLTFNHYGSTA